MAGSTVRTHHQVTFAVLVAGVVAFALLQNLVTPALPVIQKALDTSQTNVTWVLTAYLLSASIFTPIMGRLGDMTGKKRMFVVALTALALVNGHLFLPIGGQQKCPLVATRTAQSWPTDLPTRIPAASAMGEVVL